MHQHEQTCTALYAIKSPMPIQRPPIKNIQIFKKIQIKSSSIFKCPVCSSQWLPCCYLI